MRLRALDRIAKEIARRRGRGPFAATDIGALLGDKPGGWQTGKDVTAICERRDVLGFERIIAFAVALGLDVDTLFLPPTRRQS